MTLLNPPLRGARAEQPSPLQQASQLKTQLGRTRETVEGFMAFVMDDHLTMATFHAFWRQEERATLTLRAIGQSLDMDLVGVARAVSEALAFTETMSLPDFQANEAAHLFATLDSIEPDEVSVGDGRAAAERFQYAVEARSALLGHVLAVLSQRYPATTFTNLVEATHWTRAFSAMLQEAEQVIVGTQQLICDQASAIQSYLDIVSNRFELLEEQARAAALLVREDWRGQLEQAEKQMIDHLERRHAHLGTLAFGELRQTRESGWLEAVARQTVRHAPLLGSLLLTLAGGATLLSPTARDALPISAMSEAVQSGLGGLAEGTRSFPVVARRLAPPRESYGQRAHDEVAQFFSMEPRPRGRQTLNIADSGTLTRILDELGRFGYAPQDVLRLVGLGSVGELAGPMTLDLRWSQGGRPLLMPPYQVATSIASTPLDSHATAILPAVQFEGEAKPVSSMVVHYVASGDTLSALAERYDTTLTTLMQDNRLASDALQAGQMLLVRVSGEEAGVQPTGMAGVQSGGSFPSSRVPTALVAAPYAADETALVARYGTTVFPSIEAMPPDARAYFTNTVQEVADFFNVRPGDIMGILQAENNNAGLRIYQPAVSSAGARGVGQIIPRTWNGWSNPQSSTHLTDLRSIEAHGGLGFDWAMREAWRDWKEGRSDGSELAHSNADPTRFENSVAGVARHLAHWGLTRDRAASEPGPFRERLADAISVYNSGKPLAQAESFTQSAANQKTTGQYVREALAVAEATPDHIVTPLVADASLRDAYRRLMDQSLGVQVSEQELGQALDGSTMAAAVAVGTIGPDEGARQALAQTFQHYLAEGRAALAAGVPLPWPFVHDEATLAAQQVAARYLGHPLAAWEVEALVERVGGNEDALVRAIASRGDARLFAGTKQALDGALKRSERGLPIAAHEVAALVQPAVAGYSPQAMSEADLQRAMDSVQQAIRRLPEYRQVNGITPLSATPLVPMPRLIRAFGAPVTYQQGGSHTGIDIANPRTAAGEPAIYAAEQGRVVHVGPLYCSQPDACRGGRAIILDHGGNVYTIYSHNSVASVRVGQVVAAGQEIGRQGDEGYSFGSHLHFEVHSGAPFSGDWKTPFYSGQFEDPTQWLPKG